MKLQVNTKGSWRDVVEFHVARTPEVEDAAASLSRAAGGLLKMRIVDDAGEARWLNANGVFRALRAEQSS